MVSGALGKISRLCPHVFRYTDSRYFAPLPLYSAPSLGALSSCPSRLPVDPPLA